MLLGTNELIGEDLCIIIRLDEPIPLVVSRLLYYLVNLVSTRHFCYMPLGYSDSFVVVCVCIVVVVEINNMHPSTNGALFSGYKLCSAIP